MRTGLKGGEGVKQQLRFSPSFELHNQRFNETTIIRNEVKILKTLKLLITIVKMIDNYCENDQIGSCLLSLFSYSLFFCLESKAQLKGWNKCPVSRKQTKENGKKRTCSSKLFHLQLKPAVSPEDSAPPASHHAHLSEQKFHLPQRKFHFTIAIYRYYAHLSRRNSINLEICGL